MVQLFAELQKPKPRPLPDEGFGQKQRFAIRGRYRRIPHRRAGPRTAAPRITIGGRQRRLVNRRRRRTALIMRLPNSVSLASDNACAAAPPDANWAP